MASAEWLHEAVGVLVAKRQVLEERKLGPAKRGRSRDCAQSQIIRLSVLATRVVELSVQALERLATKTMAPYA
jgi:hypothetical protein